MIEQRGVDPMLTYGEIISQVASRLGYKAFEGMIKENMIQAVNWAEEELLDGTESAQRLCSLKLSSSKVSYSLNQLGVDDFGSPVEILAFDLQNNKFDVEEVPHDLWLRYDGGITSDTDNEALPQTATVSLQSDIEQLNLKNKLVISIRYEPDETGKDSDHVVSLKPAVDGTLQIRYNIVTNRDIFRRVTAYPRIQQQYHRYIVSGAVKFLAEIEAANAMARKDQMATSFFLNIQERAWSEFKHGRIRLQANNEPMTHPAVARPFIWYEDPRKYKNA